MTLKTDDVAGTAKIACDSCSASMDSVVDKNPKVMRDRAVYLAKLAQWAFEKRAGSWQHFCPYCRQSRHRGSLL